MNVESIKPEQMTRQINSTKRAELRKKLDPAMCEKCAASRDQLCFEHSKQKAYVVGSLIALASLAVGVAWFKLTGRIKKK